MLHSQKQKIYCYVDETGQDAGSKFFIVAAVILLTDPGIAKQLLLGLEHDSKIGQKKWHKSRSPQREDFLESVLANWPEGVITFYGKFKKPLPFFLPVLEVLEKAIKQVAVGDHEARIFVDGIDFKKAKELTNALRLKRISLTLAKGGRDESEPLLRLADRFAGCIRASVENHKTCKELVSRAIKKKYLQQL